MNKPRGELPPDVVGALRQLEQAIDKLGKRKGLSAEQIAEHVAEIERRGRLWLRGVRRNLGTDQ